jgi:CubicO group peptidase (beta-lactamase class C family)
MKKNLLIVIACCSITAARASQPDSLITFRQLTDSIQSLMRQDHIVGLMLGMATKDRVLFAGGFGYADKEAQQPVTANTLFRMGSITKMFVSMGIMQLVNEGKLSLQTPLKSLAPEVPFYNPWEATAPLRIIHLLEHTSGFDDIKLNNMYAADGHENKGIDMMLVHKNSMICRWQPGERTAYCNPNYAILGYLIQKLTGLPYEQYLTNTLLRPLGMYSSNFNLSSKLPQDVKEYSFEGGSIRQVKSVTLLSGAAGALWSCPTDMVKWVQLFLRNGEPLFLPTTIETMETPQSALAARAGLTSGYALGNQDVYLSAKYPFRGHSGLVGTCFSSCYYNRAMNIGFVLASNSNNNNAHIEALIVAYLQQNAPSIVLATQPIDTKAMAPYLGMYQFESPRNAISGFMDKLQNAPRIYLQNGGLFIKPLTGKASPLVQTAPLTFAWQGDNTARIVFTTNNKGQRVMMQGGTYYAQTSYALSMAYRLLLLLAVLLAIGGALAGPVAIAQKIRGRLSGPLLPRLLPLIGLGSLSLAILNLLNVQKYTYKLSELGSVNFRTLAIFLGTSLYAITAMATLVWALQKLIKQKKGWGWALVGIGMCTIAWVLWQNGWIGLRTWAM